MFSIFEKNRTNDIGFALDVLSEKNRTISRNIANADTPTYRAKKLEFDEVMAEHFSSKTTTTLYTTNEKHMQVGSTPVDASDFVRRQNNPSLRTDGNDVNLDYEMSEQAGSAIMYSMLSEIVGGKFGSLKDIITGR